MRTLPAALLAGIVVVASGCSTSVGSDGSADAKSYYDSYTEQGGDSSGSTGSGRNGSASSGSGQGGPGQGASPLGGSPQGGTAPNGPPGPYAPSGPTGPTGPRQSWPVPPTDPRPTDPDLRDVEPGGFVETRVRPTSTFGADVDTGSYRFARASLDEGVLPSPDTVRVEEWLNAFDSGFPTPARKDLELRSDQALSPTGETRLVRIGLQARQIDKSDWPPVALTMVVDTSGSMDSRERLGLVKASLAVLVQNLRPTDTIAIVTYETDALPLLEPTPVRHTDTILTAIDRLRAGGSTNLEAGLLLGYDRAREAFRSDATNVVLLASDGVANVGVTDGRELASAIRDNGRRGIHLVTVGYGMGSYNDHLMEQLADRGDGFYAYVDTFEEARRLFVDDLRSTLTPVAKDTKIQVEFDPETVSAYRLVGYENRALADEDFDDPTVDAGEIGAGHRVTALYEVRTTRLADDGVSLGSARVRWRSTVDGEQNEDALTLRLGPTEQPRGALGVAAAVVDVARLVQSGQSTLPRDLVRRVQALEDEEAPGATELASLVEAVRSVD
ncbi:vWA domain-containing protein [Knoellia sp. CPCC 206450]|uniref:vWA domain-containing protein n=1 Tax=Knoellia tibetensis TaxID=3404798 RepID=UPI003B436265